MPYSILRMLTAPILFALCVTDLTHANNHVWTEQAPSEIDSGIAVPSGLTGINVYALAIAATSPRTLYAGAEGGIFKSMNGGSDWDAINTGLAVNSNSKAYALAIDTASPEY